MRCEKCGYDNDYDATFCEKCGANLRAPAGMSPLTKGLIVAVIILVAILGVVAGAMMMNNQTAPANNTSVNENTDDSGQASTKTTQSSSDYKTFNNGLISFKYPSSWDVLPNGANTMAVVGDSDYPHFSVYDESKYGHTSLSDYVNSSKKGMNEDGFTAISEGSTTVGGYPAYKLIYQGENKVLHMVLVEKSPGSKYYALEGSDYISNYGQSESIFNQIINSFNFL